MRKVNPLKRYERPAYPTIDEIGLADLSRAPARWARLRSVVASLGTVALTMKAFAQDAAPTAPTIRPTGFFFFDAPSRIVPVRPVVHRPEGMLLRPFRSSIISRADW